MSTESSRAVFYKAEGDIFRGRVLKHGQGVPSLMAKTLNLADAEEIAAALNAYEPAVPCDDAAVERVAAMFERELCPKFPRVARRMAEKALRAAGETP